MAHEIFGERIALRDAPAWHGLGTIFDASLTATEAGELAGMFDYEVKKLPIGIELPSHWQTPDNGEIEDSYFAPQSWAVVRSPTAGDPMPKIFGHVSDVYTVLDNKDLARILDPLTAEWPVESAAVLKSGAHVFLTLKSGTTEINGDELTEYFFVTADHSGKEGVRIGYSPVRMVCWNTLSAGVSRATEMITIAHSGDVLEKAEFHVELFQKLRAAQRKALDFFEEMGGVTLADHEIDDVFAAAWPYYDDTPAIEQYRMIVENDGDEGLDDLKERYPGQFQRLRREILRQNSVNGRADSYRDAAWERLAHWNDENPAHANTAWNVWAGAVTEVSDWRDGRDAMAYSSVLGARAQEKQRAFGRIVELLDIDKAYMTKEELERERVPVR